MTTSAILAVRAAVAADAAAARRLIGGMGGHDDVAAAPGFDTAFAGAMASPDVRGFLAEVGGRAVGYAEAHRRWSTLHARREAWLAVLAVDPGFRRTGTGRALIDAVDAAAVELGCDDIVLESSSWREAARAFYLGLGFIDQPTAHRYRRPVGPS